MCLATHTVHSIRRRRLYRRLLLFYRDQITNIDTIHQTGPTLAQLQLDLGRDWAKCIIDTCETADGDLRHREKRVTAADMIHARMFLIHR